VERSWAVPGMAIAEQFAIAGAPSATAA